ncbi:hypothetical protein I588_05218 [Enterococcus pallens ATCC BAA-351]|uniref:Transposase DDE domain-containing protein n=1 Tax=Enterococcus pallens ATCC BAA-351 TaxID=1158607 RepID=R2SDR6_9ENTE|nr:hypothetical protein UAU_05216 [Enterococcus pallens ATCC BAA-351]EOU09485.1 hypothetical protein I588_05218 [Enterococcus pallens ATCC BAA-351]OJG77521.1 hypothetical protein RV10_GL002355 [Enterococcus pallens]
MSYEINVQHQKEGKRPFILDKESELTERKISKADPESGYYVKGEREKQFAYSAHTACDKHGFVLDVMVILIAKLPLFFTDPFTTCITLYQTGKKEFLSLKMYVYDEYYDCYLCPGNQELIFSTVNRKGYRKYKSDPKKCMLCPLLNHCTQSEKHQKVNNRHVWVAYVEKAEHLQHTELNRKLYRHRKEPIERVFVYAKEKHGIRWTKYHVLEKVNLIQCLRLLQ